MAIWPPRFEEKLHPRGHGGQFSDKPDAPGAPRPGPRKAAPKPGPLKAAKPAAPAKAAKAAKKATPTPQRRRPPVRYNPASASRLQDAGQPDIGPASTPQAPDASGPPLGSGPRLGEGDAVLGRYTPRESTIPIGGPLASMLAMGRRPDGTMDWESRGSYVDERLTYLRDNGIDSQSLYKKNGEWTPERRAKQEALIEEIWQSRAAHVPNEGRGIFSGGLGGAGKGYALGKVEKVSDRDFFTVNPDDVKELMAKRDMIPLELDPLMTPMELSPTVHEEASDIAKELAKRAYKQKKNVVWDLTMSSEGSIMGRVDTMRKHGYTNIGAMFVDTTVDRSVTQAMSRWQRGMNDLIADGAGEGGRFLPSKATKENLPTPGSAYHSRNREVFEAIKHNFDGSILYQNLGDGMKHIETKGKGLPK